MSVQTRQSAVEETYPRAYWRVESAPVRALAFVRGKAGIVLAVADGAGTIQVFDPLTGALAPGLLVPTAEAGAPEDTAAVQDLSWLPRRSGFPYLVAVTADGTTRAYDLESGREHSTVRLPVPEPMSSIETFQEPDGSATIAIGGSSESVYLWRGRERQLVSLPGHRPPVRSMRVLRSSRRLAVADDDGIVVWDLCAETPVRLCRGPGRARSLTVVRNQLGGELLAAAMADGVHLRDPRTGEDVSRFARDASSAAVFQWADGGQVLAVGGEGGVTVWSPDSEQQLASLARVHPGPVRVIRRILTSEGTLLAAGDESGGVAVWLLATGWAVNQIGQHGDWINDLAVFRGPDGAPVLASASDDHQVMLWRARTLIAGVGALSHGAQVQAVAAIRDGIVTGDQRGVVRRWRIDPIRVQPDWTRSAGRGAVRAITSFRSQAGWRIVSASADGCCLLWDAETGEVSRELSLRGQADRSDGSGGKPVRALAAVESDRNWLVAAGDAAGRIVVWDAASGARQWETSTPHDGAQVRCLAVITVADQLTLASGGDDGALRLWDLRDGTLLSCRPGAHTGAISALHLLARGRYRRLVSGGADRYLKLWNPFDLTQPLDQLPEAHVGWVRALAHLRPKGRVLIASGGEEGAICLWEVVDDRLKPYQGFHPFIRGFRDRPAAVDLLDRRIFCDHLCDLLGPGGSGIEVGTTSGPQGVMIQGPWGTGKTSLMRDLCDLLSSPPASPDPPRAGCPGQRNAELTPHQVSKLTRARPERPRLPTDRRQRPPASRTVTVWFNPWEHESSEQVWAGLATAIVDATRSYLGDTDADRQRYWLRRNLPRLDGAALRRIIRQRIWRPTLAALAALVVPLVIATVQTEWFRPAELSEAGNWLPLGLLICVAVVVVVLGVHALHQYYFGRVSAYLPADVFDGPVHQPVTAAGERLVRDLPYVSSTGQLYRCYEDVRRIAEDLEARRCQLVVFIDDLDRCSSSNVAGVLEAINSFMASGSPPRFVIGLDTTVVASRLVETYPADLPELRDVDDPHRGWSLLRKLAQLTVVLPATRSAHVTRLLLRHAQPAGEDPAGSVAGSSPAAGEGRPVAGMPRQPGPARPRTAGLTRPAVASARTIALGALESHPEIQQHLTALVRCRPRQAMRENKRLLTQWAFYIRLLRDMFPGASAAGLSDARDAMTLAEIVVRFPALVPALARSGDARSGLAELINAVARDQTDIWHRGWHATVRELGLSRPEYATVVGNLHQLLIAHGTPRVAEFADKLL